MAIVVEILNSSKQVIKHYVFNKLQLSIGRSYSNDVVISDAHIDPMHASISYDESDNQFYCEDLDTVNGIKIGKSNIKNKSVALMPESIIALGKTRLRIFPLSDHIKPAIPLSLFEDISDGLNRWWVMLISLALLTVFLVAGIYIEKPPGFNKTDDFLGLFVVLICAVLYAGFFALLGKSLRHDGRFGVYFTIFCLMLLIATVYGFLVMVVYFNLADRQVSQWLDPLVYALICYFLFSLSLRYATHLKTVSRVLLSLILPVIVLFGVVSKLLVDDEKYVARPMYDNRILHEVFQIRPTKEHSDLVEQTTNLFSNAAVE